MPNYDSPRKIFEYKTVFYFSVIILVSLTVINLIGTNALSTQGFVVSASEARTMQLEKENKLLTIKIEEATTLGNLQKLAESRGYVRSTNIVFAPTVSTFASR